MPHSGGRSVVNASFLASFDKDYLFCNLLLHAQDWEARDNSGAKDPSKHDADGYCHTIYNTGVYGRTRAPSALERPGNYILKWGGSGTCGATGLAAQTGANGRHVFLPGATTIDVFVSGVTTPGSVYPHPIALIHEDDEALYDADPLAISPYWLSKHVKTGVWRTLDPVNSNFSNVVKFADRLPVSHWSFAAPRYPSQYWAGSTSNVGDAYTATLSGFVLVDKAQVIVNFNADASGTAPTLDVSGTGIKTIRNEFGGTLSSSRRPKSGRVGTLTYDAVLDCWLKHGGDTNLFSQGIASGMPIEVIAKICKAIGAHPWVLSPYLTVDPLSDWTAGQATYLKNFAESEAPWMKPTNEPPNETWNSGFWSTQYAWLMEAARGHGNFDTHFWYGRALAKVGKVIDTIYAGDRSKYDVCCGVHLYGSVSAFRERLDSTRYVSETGNAADAAKYYATRVAPSNYWSPSFDGTAAAQTMADEYATATAERREELIVEYVESDAGSGSSRSFVDCLAQIDLWNTFRNSFGVTLGLTFYEGGYSVTGYLAGDANLDAFQRASYYSQSLYNKTIEMYDYIISIGGEFPSLYKFSGPNEWAVFAPSIRDTPSTEWDAILAWNGVGEPEPTPQPDNTGHDGKRKGKKPKNRREAAPPRQEYPTDDDRPAKKPQHEVNREKYVKDRNSLLSLLKRLFGLTDDEPKIAQMQFLAEAPTAKPASPALMKFIKTGELPIQEMKAKVPEAVDTKAFDDVVAEYDRMREQMLKDDEEVAFIVAMMH